MKSMKKLLSLVMALAMILSLTAVAGAAGTTVYKVKVSDFTDAETPTNLTAPSVDWGSDADDTIKAAFVTATTTAVTVKATVAVRSETATITLDSTTLPRGYTADAATVADGEATVVLKDSNSKEVVELSWTGLADLAAGDATFKLSGKSIAEGTAIDSLDDSQGSVDATVSFEGPAPENVINLVMPLVTTQFDFWMDPNKLVTATYGATFGDHSATQENPADLEQNATVFFQTVSDTSYENVKEKVPASTGAEMVKYTYKLTADATEATAYWDSTDEQFVDSTKAAVAALADKTLDDVTGTFKTGDTAPTTTPYILRNIKVKTEDVSVKDSSNKVYNVYTFTDTTDSSTFDAYYKTEDSKWYKADLTTVDTDITATIGADGAVTVTAPHGKTAARKTQNVKGVAYKSQSDPVTIYNKSSMALSVTMGVEMPKANLTGVTFASSTEFKNASGADLTDKALYMALKAKKSDDTDYTTKVVSLASDEATKATATATLDLGNLANAYKSVRNSDGTYGKELKSAYARKDNTDFPSVSFYLTGATNDKGWDSFNQTPQIKVTWTVSKEAAADTSAEPVTIAEPTLTGSAGSIPNGGSFTITVSDNTSHATLKSLSYYTSNDATGTAVEVASSGYTTTTDSDGGTATIVLNSATCSQMFNMNPWPKSFTAVFELTGAEDVSVNLTGLS